MESFGPFDVLRNLLTNEETYLNNIIQPNTDARFTDSTDCSVSPNSQIFDYDIGQICYERPQRSEIAEDCRDFRIRGLSELAPEFPSNQKTENKTDCIYEEFYNIKVDRISVRKIVTRRFRRCRYQTKIPFKEFFKFSNVPDFDQIIRAKLLSTQEKINKFCLLNSLKRKYGPSLPESAIRRKLTKNYNHLISIQPLNMKPLSSDDEISLESNSQSSESCEIVDVSDQECPVDNESQRMFPPESYRTPEKQQIRKIDPRTFRSKLQPGILVAPQNYKSNLDDANVIKNDALRVHMPRNCSDKPIVYEFGSSDNNFAITDRTIAMLRLEKVEKMEVEENNQDDTFEYLNVTCRPKKARYDRQFQMPVNAQSDNEILTQVTPRRKLLQRFEEVESRPGLKVRPLISSNSISIGSLNDFHDFKLLRDSKDLKCSLETGAENFDPDKDGDMPRSPSTPDLKFYPRLMH